MSKLYDRAEIYDLIDSEKRIEITRKDWKQFLGDRQIRTFLDVSIGSGSMTLPLVVPSRFTDVHSEGRGEFPGRQGNHLPSVMMDIRNKR